MDNIIKLTPQKEFFIEMITRDITLEACILELIDNSIDGYLRKNISNPNIRLIFKENSFTIEDNCGGIPLAIAKDYAFNFGKSTSDFEKDNIKNSIGRFGIGMKRSIFKLGKNIRIETNDGSDSYFILLDVKKWKGIKDWVLPFNYMDIGDVPIGTKIEITDLNPGVMEIVQDQVFFNRIVRLIASRFKEYLVIENAIKIDLNMFGVEKTVSYEDADEELVKNDIVKPTVTILDKNGVKIKIIVGAIKRIEEGKYNVNKAGWYLYCNNRLVIEADQTELTGWGTQGLSKFHVERARRFRGYCYLNSVDSRKLPWNTTKTSVEEESDLYREIKQMMIKNTTAYLTIIEKLEELDKGDAGDKNLIDELEHGSMKVNNSMSLEATNVIQEVLKKIPDKVTIAYKKRRSEVEKIRTAYNRSNAADVGRMTYEYFLDMEEIL